MTRISVIIPSRLDGFTAPDGSTMLFLERAVKSIRRQSLAENIDYEILVGVDEGTQGTAALAEKLDVRFVQSGGHTQVLALNAAVRQATGDYLCFLEDDDRWHPWFIKVALQALKGCGFVSSTQLELDSSDEVLRINDFPTPSGWVMTRATWEEVGEFCDDYRWHLDNEWLGRLGQSTVKRAHLIESTAPLSQRDASLVRPILAKVLKYGGPSAKLLRHNLPVPLVFRLVHPQSGVQRIIRDEQLKSQSDDEYARLTGRFGHIPS